MSRENEDKLERELAALTRWQRGDVQAWRAALAAERGTNRASIFKQFWSRGSAKWLPVGIAAAALLLIAVPVLHSIGSRVQRETLTEYRYSSVASMSSRGKPADGYDGYFSASPEVLLEGRATPSRFMSTSTGDAELAARNAGPGVGAFSGENIEAFPQHSYTAIASPETKAQLGPLASVPDRPAAAPDRHVIRKATIELRTLDVRAAFLKAAHLVSEAQGEYVQESSLTGSEQRLDGQLTLRIATERLSAVLQALRELGTVRSETSGGEDVTTQVVDLEARVSNERRVEAELLQLMEKRTDAPLKEVLELRTAISNVRQSIETMTAQRERLSRLVALATVLVIIRPADAPEPASPGLWNYFTTAVSRAAERGMQALINTVAGFILVLIGGALWILILAAIAIGIVRRLRSTRPQA